MTAFAELALSPELLRALSVLEFTEMTPVQEHSLPPLLLSQDVIAQARTGSGKTVAFALGLLSQINVAEAKIQSLVLCPTRELAQQVSNEIRRVARFLPNLKVVTLCGGVPVRTQAPSLQRAPHVVVGTPGRVLDHLDRGNLDFSAVTVWVLDEADRMLEMGFVEAMEAVARAMPRRRQTLLFSATFPDSIRRLSRKFQSSPVEITVDTKPAQVEIEQTFFATEAATKVDALTSLLGSYQPPSALVFCQTKKDTQAVAEALQKRGFFALALHGDLEQRERDEVLVRFSNQSCTVLVATDVAARGLDVKELAAVISYELPNRPDVHLHRIGRTGRAGHQGLALHLCAPRERARVKTIEAEQGAPVRWGKLDAASRNLTPARAPMVTLLIYAGRKDKLRPGDLLGALTGDVGLPASAVGKIDIFPRVTFVAIARSEVNGALAGLQQHKVKGRRVRVERIG